MLKIEKYVRKPFFVDMVTVTPENMAEVAEWCGGKIEKEKQGRREVQFIKVPVVRPMSEKQTKAFVKDKVLKTETGVKVYTQDAFHACFQKAEKKLSVTAAELLGQPLMPHQVAYIDKVQENHPDRRINLLIVGEDGEVQGSVSSPIDRPKYEVYDAELRGQEPLFEIVDEVTAREVCGNTKHTIDHKPCILDKDHGKRACSSIMLPLATPGEILDMSGTNNPKFPKGYPKPSGR